MISNFLLRAKLSSVTFQAKIMFSSLYNVWNCNALLVMPKTIQNLPNSLNPLSSRIQKKSKRGSNKKEQEYLFPCKKISKANNEGFFQKLILQRYLL
jgi:hypothetical protein